MWEDVTPDVDRLPVPGGWLYRVDAPEWVGVRVVFVPDPKRYDTSGGPG